MTALEQFVMTVRNLSASGSFDNLADFCVKSSELLVNNALHLDEVLATLTLADHSIGILAVLVANLKILSNNFGDNNSMNDSNSDNHSNDVNNDNNDVNNIAGENGGGGGGGFGGNNDMLDLLIDDVDQPGGQHHPQQGLEVLDDERRHGYELLLPRIKEFIDGCNDVQVRHSSDLFATLCHLYSQAMLITGKGIKSINPLLRAIGKIQTHPGLLTSIHADVAEVCLTSQCVKPILPLLDVDVTEISKECGHYDVRFFLRYYYFGGIIYSLVQDYERSLYFFESCLTTTSMAVSKIMLQAYKKYILVSLILHGKVVSLPKYTPQVVGREMKPFCEAYLALAQAYLTHSPLEVKKVMMDHSNVFTIDKNNGLVKQVLTSLHKNNVQRLTKTFVTLSLTDVAARAFLEPADETSDATQAAEDHVVGMIESGEIFARISHRDNGMVSFLDNPDKFDSARMFHRLEKQMREVMSAEDQLKKMDQELALNSKYVHKMLRSSAHDTE